LKNSVAVGMLQVEIARGITPQIGSGEQRNLSAKFAQIASIATCDGAEFAFLNPLRSRRNRDPP
jgi:hypothetical protein